VINALLRPNRYSRVVINLEVKETNAKEGDIMDPHDGYVVFDRSELVCGNIGKKVLGPSKDGLFYTLNRDNSPKIAADVMLRFSKLASRWISHYGFTIGIGDVTPSPELVKHKAEKIREGYANYQLDLDRFERG